MKAISRYSLIAMLCMVAVSAINAQEERIKTLNDSWDGITRINVKHRHGTLEVIPHTADDVKLIAQIMVKAKNTKDADIMIDHLEIKSNKFSDELEIETDFNAKSWMSSGNTTKVKFEDGDKVSGILDYDVKYKLYIPELKRLELSNRYYDIELIDDVIIEELLIKQYDANVRTRNVSGELFLAMKYADARIGEVGNANFDLYDSEAEITSTKDTYIESKYSELTIESTGELEMDTYDDKFQIGTVNGDLSIDDKYSEFEIESAKTAKVFIYDGDLKLGRVGAYTGRSKYSDISIIDVQSMDLERSYDDNYAIRNLGSFTCYESKYTEYEIENLGNSARLNSYDDEFIVGNLSKDFEKFDLDCKYTNVKLPLDELNGYTLDATSKYGSLKHADPADTQLYKVDNSVLEIKAQIGSPSKTEVTIKAHDSNIKLN